MTLIAAGLDLSLCATGICVLSDEITAGTIATKPKDFKSIYHRIDWISEKIFIHLPESVELVCVESPFVRVMRGGIDSSSKHLIALSHIVRRELTYRNIPFIDVAATQLKKFILGKGKGEKSLILKEVFKRYGFEAQDDNQADACVLAHVAQAVLIRNDESLAESLLQYQREVVDKLTAA